MKHVWMLYVGVIVAVLWASEEGLIGVPREGTPVAFPPPQPAPALEISQEQPHPVPIAPVVTRKLSGPELVRARVTQRVIAKKVSAWADDVAQWWQRASSQDALASLQEE